MTCSVLSFCILLVDESCHIHTAVSVCKLGSESHRPTSTNVESDEGKLLQQSALSISSGESMSNLKASIATSNYMDVPHSLQSYTINDLVCAIIVLHEIATRMRRAHRGQHSMIGGRTRLDHAYSHDKRALLYASMVAFRSRSRVLRVCTDAYKCVRAYIRTHVRVHALLLACVQRTHCKVPL